jgi:hypothetical protein
MGEISDINYSSLATTAKLPIFQHYDIDESLHSSSDGQKIESRNNTVNSRHSPKYFGLGKGIVSYTMVANHIPVNARIIGANEHVSLPQDGGVFGKLFIISIPSFYENEGIFKTN